MSKKITDNDYRAIINFIEKLNGAFSDLNKNDYYGSKLSGLKSKALLSEILKEFAFSFEKEGTGSAKKLAKVYEAISDLIVDYDNSNFFQE